MILNSTDILCANLERLGRTEPELVRRLEQVEPAGLTWSASKSGPPAATIDLAGKPVWLCSRYDPEAEAEQLNRTIDRTLHGGIVMLGMGLGHHVQEASKHLDDTTIMVVYEPNLPLMRAVLERMDHTSWLGRPNIIMVDHTMDRAGLINRLEKFGGIITQGTVLVTNPASRRLNGAELTEFGKTVSEVLSFCRTTVATTLVNMSRTVNNVCMNLAHYTAGANTNELYGAAKGMPAVCVGAGPSLAKNVHLLKDPAVRKNVIVISAQTTLKPLLDRGIRPDFVTALDYHEISARFYEALPDDLPDVTLVAEPKVNPSVVDRYPGPVRVTQNKFLDKLLGELAQPIMPIQAGATVAHLSVYLAQHLGCETIILIGQDLGFSDGLYYCPGTAIHDVWEPELNSFNTVEMMEWQRIVRHRGALEKADDIYGRPIFTDEQMVTYLKQFERDFVHARQKIIDATEGGVPKEHTERMSLAEALKTYATTPAPKLPLPPRSLSKRRLEAVRGLLRQRVEEATEIRGLSVRTMPLLRQMLEHQRDKARAEKLYEQVQQHKKRVESLTVTFSLINQLNTVGTFRRARADRAIHHSDAQSFEYQKRVLERDIDNLDWLIQACDEALRIFNEAMARINAAGKKE